MRKWPAFLAVIWLIGSAPTSLAQERQLLPVPLRTIFPGQALVGGDFTLKLFTVSAQSRRSFVFEQGQLSDMEAARTLVAGKPIALGSLRVIEDIKKGQPTKAIYNSGGIEIQGLLMPLTGGSVGQTIEARNASSGGIVKVQILEDGTLAVIGK
jgi:flagellar basal body P-ring formation protein FlgA